MSVPAMVDLDDMTALIAGNGVTFDSLAPDYRVKIVELVNGGDIYEMLENIQKELTKVGEWFANSKTYYP